METVNILWTGGLDSTYRIIELSKLPVTIQPYYILDHGRKSKKHELRAMDRISKEVKANPDTKAELLSVKTIHDSDIKTDSNITEAWKIINKKYQLGSQYDFLARFAKQYGLKLEVGLEASERSKAANTIKSETKLKKKTTSLTGGGEHSVYQIITSSSSNEAVLLFENLLFPATLWHMSKLDEVEAYKNLGFGKTIYKTWFCHNPIFGLPCGHCNPCKDCLNEGMAFRVPHTGYILGAIRNLCFKPLKAFKHIINKK